MKRTKEDPIELFESEPLVESRVFSLCKPNDMAVVLVTDFAWNFESRRPGTGQRRLYEFFGVTTFDQTEVRAAGAFQGEFQYGPDTATHVVSHHTVVQVGESKFLMKLWLSDLGVFNLEFENLWTTRMDTVAEKIDGNWVHRDAATESRIDFYRPFGNVCGKDPYPES
jgi:hypothetical protein